MVVLVRGVCAHAHVCMCACVHVCVSWLRAATLPKVLALEIIYYTDRIVLKLTVITGTNGPIRILDCRSGEMGVLV